MRSFLLLLILIFPSPNAGAENDVWKRNITSAFGGRELKEILTPGKCVYDYFHGRTRCKHHDGTIWLGGGAKSTPRSVGESAASTMIGFPSRPDSQRLSIADRIQKQATANAKHRQRTKLSPASSTASSSQIAPASTSVKSTHLASSSSLSSMSSSSSLSSSSSSSSSPWVVSCFDRQCEPWRDTDGHRIHAHGGGLLRTANGTFFWYGESEKVSGLDGRSAFSRSDQQEHACAFSLGVNCYSSMSLGGPWKFVGNVFPQSRIKGVSGLSDAHRPFIMERPKVIYNRATSQYILWFHLDKCNTPTSAEQQHADSSAGMHRVRRYSFRSAGVAVAKAPEGPFKFVHAVQPDGLESLDLQLFQEPTDPDRAFLIRSVSNQFVAISPLSRDFLNCEKDISSEGPTSTIKPALEGMAIFRYPYATERDGGGSLFAIMSHLTGWEPNPLVMLRAVQGRRRAEAIENGIKRNGIKRNGTRPVSDRGDFSSDLKHDQGWQRRRRRYLLANPLLQSLSLARKSSDRSKDTLPWWQRKSSGQRGAASKTNSIALHDIVHGANAAHPVRPGYPDEKDKDDGGDDDEGEKDYEGEEDTRGEVRKHRQRRNIYDKGRAIAKPSDRRREQHGETHQLSQKELFPSLGDSSLSWEDLGNPTHHFRSHNAQPTFVFSAPAHLGGLIDRRSGRPFALLMADNWLYAGPRGLRDAGYIWLPIEFGFAGNSGGGATGTTGERGIYTARVRKLTNWSMDDPFA